MFQKNIYLNQPNNFVNIGGNLNNQNLLNNQMNFMHYNNLMNQPFPNPNPQLLNNNMMFPFMNLNLVHPQIMPNNPNMFQMWQNNFIKNANQEITINFRFMKNLKSFQAKANRTEKLIDVINRFKINGCPQDILNCLSACACNGNQADQNKTLIELGINNGEQILFIGKISSSDQTKFIATKKDEYVLTEKEKIQHERLMAQYDAKILIKNSFKNRIVTQQAAWGNNDNNYEEEEQSFSDFMKEIDNGVGIIVNEHKHILVYCLTIKDWQCNICNTNFTKNKGRYYCSLCNYNMCEACHEKNKYFMKKSFPEGVKPSNSAITEPFLNTDYHEHKLVFCRASKKFAFFNGWNCNNCLESHDNDIWLYYCTCCDFNLCLKCCGYI